MLGSYFSADGVFLARGAFRFNQVVAANLATRILVIKSISEAADEEFSMLTFEARKRVLLFLKQETARFYGTALRTHEGRGGEPVGSPLPRLSFETHDQGALYRRVLFEAGARFRQYLNKHTTATAQRRAS